DTAGICYVSRAQGRRRRCIEIISCAGFRRYGLGHTGKTVKSKGTGPPVSGGRAASLLSDAHDVVQRIIAGVRLPVESIARIGFKSRSCPAQTIKAEHPLFASFIRGGVAVVRETGL